MTSRSAHRYQETTTERCSQKGVSALPSPYPLSQLPTTTRGEKRERKQEKRKKKKRGQERTVEVAKTKKKKTNTIYHDFTSL
jgi:radical SAM superfamily enzyme YgiQ (UPF0313 family)